MNAHTTDLQPFLAHRSFVRSLAASLLWDPSDVDDVEQETWISALHGPEEEIRDARSWLGKVVRNHARNRGRHKARAKRRERASAKSEAVEPEAETIARMETARVLVANVMELPQPNRAVILLRFYEGYSVRETANRLGVGPAVVKGRQQRGLAELRANLERDRKRSAEDWHRDLAALAAAPLPVKGVLALGAPWVLALGAAGVVGAGIAFFPRAEGVLDHSQGAGHSTLVQGPAQIAVAQVALTAPDEGAAAARASRQPVGVSGVQGESTSGEIVLRIGDGFVFGEDTVRPDGDRSSLDLYVQDIRHGVSLATLAGGSEPALPLSSVGLPVEPRALMAYLADAPLNMPKRDLWLLEECSVARPGIGLAMGRDGQAYRLCLLELDGHPEALQRTVRIAYEPVPSVQGGGVLRLPETEGKPAEPALAALREALRIGSLIPGDTFSRSMNGDYTTVAELADGTVLEEGAHVVLTTELRGKALLHNRSTLFATDGVGAQGVLDLQASGAIGVQGPMQGRIDLDAYGYVYVDGPLMGELSLDSYATVVLEQGLAGKLNLRSYGNILIRGGITGELDAAGSCWSTIYLDGVYTEAQLIEISVQGEDMDQVTLHVRLANLPDGEHEGIGTWRKVIVGDPIWNQLTR